MRKLISLIITAAIICNSTAAVMPASALEVATYEEYTEKRKEIEEFPDPEEKYFTFKDENFVYHVYNDFALLSEYSDTKAKEVTIPAYIIHPDTKKEMPVIGIVDTPFGSCWDLEKITIPDTMTKYSWYDLSLTTMVKSGSDADPIPKLKEIVVSNTNPNYTVHDGMLFTKDLGTIIGCPPALDITELALPEKTDTISDYAFLACYKLEKAVIPSTVKHIHNNAFAGCIGLKSAELPDTISSVSADMFFFCSSLTSIKLNGTITTIGYGAFNQCSSLTDFSIPNTVNAIGRDAFEGTSLFENIDGIHYLNNWVVGSDENIEKAILRDGTIGIAEMSFMVRKDCSLIDIPASVKHIGYICYTGLSSGTAATVEFKAETLPEKAFAAAKNVTDFYIYDPSCDIFDSDKTIPAEFKHKNPQSTGELIWTSDSNTVTFNPSISITSDDNLISTDNTITGEVTIHGYEASTAQEYAKKYGRKFIPITSSIETSATASTTVTTSTSTTTTTSTVNTVQSTTKTLAETTQTTTSAVTVISQSTVPSSSVHPITNTSSAIITTTTTSIAAPDQNEILYGDANYDGKVSIADATAILQYIANRDKYKLTDKGMKNADCCDVGDGITAKDALAIQKLDAKLIDNLPI